MVEMNSVTSPGMPERRYEYRRRRVRRKPEWQPETPRDPRYFRIAVGTILLGLLVALFLVCAGGKGGVGTPGMNVSSNEAGLSVGNPNVDRMYAVAVSLWPPGVGGDSYRDGDAATISNLSGSLFAMVFGVSRGVPSGFWVGVP